jgi:putative tryptophan/tyrosine transport system substrate-binding protein
MRRREFIGGRGGVVAWPAAARAQQQQAAMPTIGWLSAIAAQAQQPSLAAFRKALGDAGYIEGRNVQIEYRWADGEYGQLPKMAADFVARDVALIVTAGGEPSAFAAKAATSTIRIVMVTGGDPVSERLVANLSRPGGNITGATVFAYETEAKRLGLLHEAVPVAKIITGLFNPANPDVDLQLRDVRQAAARIGVEIITFSANADYKFDGLFATMAQRQVGALLVGAEPLFNSRRTQLIALAAQHRLPAVYEWLSSPSMVA